MRFLKILVPVCFVILCGCANGIVNCTDEYVSGIEVTLLDLETNQPILEGKVLGLVRDGNYIDTMHVSFKSSADVIDYRLLRGAGERAGKYSVSIQLDGYETWTKENVVVSRNECHVITQEITAFLKKK